MFIKESSRRRKDGSQVTYLQLVVSQWDPRAQTSRQRVLHNLGRKDQLDQEGLQRLISSLARYLDCPDTTARPEQPQQAPAPLLQARPLGLTWLLLHLWRSQAWSRACAPELPPEASLALFKLVARRALGPEAHTAPSLQPCPTLPDQAWHPPTSPEAERQTLAQIPSLTSSLHSWPGLTPDHLAIVSQTSADLTLATDLHGLPLAHGDDALPLINARPLILMPPSTLAQADLDRGHHHRLWRFEPEEDQAFDALTRGKGRYRKANQDTSFRDTLWTHHKRRYRAFLVRREDQRHILLTDEHQLPPEDLITAELNHHPTLHLLQSLRAPARRLPHDPQDLWLDLCALALRLATSRLTQLPWPLLLQQTQGLFALQHQGQSHETPSTPSDAVRTLYQRLQIPIPSPASDLLSQIP